MAQFTVPSGSSTLNHLHFDGILGSDNNFVKKSLFVAIEGVDGSGKTTTASLLAERLNGVYLKTPPKEFHQMRHLVDSMAKTSRRQLIYSRFFFYVAALYETADSISSFLDEGTSVVVDRWILSTLLYHEQLLGEDLSVFLNEFVLPTPDVCFILQPPLGVILNRLQQRVPTYDHALEQDHVFISRMYDRYAAVRDSIHIKPEGESVDEVVETMAAVYLPSLPAMEVCHA